MWTKCLLEEDEGETLSSPSDRKDDEVLPPLEMKEPITVSSEEIPPEVQNIAIADVLNSLIVDEFEAIDQYNSAISTITSIGTDKYNDMLNVLNDILNEENIHVGQLQELLKQVSPSAVSIEDGEEEAKEVLKDKENE